MTRGKRKRRTFGTLTERTRGTWCLQWWANTPQGRVRRSETVYGTRREAEYRLAQIQAETRLSDPTEATVGDVFETWRELKAQSVKPSTMAQYDSSWRVSVAPRWAHVPVSQVKRGDVQAWLLALPGRAKLARNVLSMVMAFACDDLELIAKNPAAGRFALPQSATECRDVYTAAELDAICDAARGSIFEAAVILMAQAGVRVGESLAVMTEEVVEGIGGGFCTVAVVRQVMQQKRPQRWGLRSSCRVRRVGGGAFAEVSEAHLEAESLKVRRHCANSRIDHAEGASVAPHVVEALLTLEVGEHDGWQVGVLAELLGRAQGRVDGGLDRLVVRTLPREQLFDGVCGRLGAVGMLPPLDGGGAHVHECREVGLAEAHGLADGAEGGFVHG